MGSDGPCRLGVGCARLCKIIFHSLVKVFWVQGNGFHVLFVDLSRSRAIWEGRIQVRAEKGGIEFWAGLVCVGGGVTRQVGRAGIFRAGTLGGLGFWAGHCAQVDGGVAQVARAFGMSLHAAPVASFLA